jgi:Zn-finger nucleic acid-binding protein
MGVIIDKCPSCQGVWLDGGELDLVKQALESKADDEWLEGLVIGMASGRASS